MGDVAFHSRSSARRFGGVPEDYAKIHAFLDQSKLFLADWRHRALLHTTFGIKLVEDVFGDLITNSDGQTVSTRTVASVHIVEDLGFIPTPHVFLAELPIRPWMNGAGVAERKAFGRMEAARSGDPVPPTLCAALDAADEAMRGAGLDPALRRTITDAMRTNLERPDATPDS